MTAFRPEECAQLEGRFPGATTHDSPDGTTLVALPDLALPSGWSTSRTSVWFVVPIGYPAAQPDCFWAEPDLRLADGSLPMNTGPQPVPVLARPALWFSWHLTAWRPSHDSLVTYARFIARRFDDAR